MTQHLQVIVHRSGIDAFSLRKAVCLFIAIGWIPFAAYGQVAAPTKSKGTDPVIDQLDQDLPRLTSVFSYSLQKDGLSDKRLKITPLAERMKVAATTEGVRLVQSATGQATAIEIIPRCSLEGDFDIEVALSVGDQQRQGRLWHFPDDHAGCAGATDARDRAHPNRERPERRERVQFFSTEGWQPSLAR
jgi:hypothetical protein